MKQTFYMDDDHNAVDEKDASLAVTRETDEDGKLISERWDILKETKEVKEKER